MRGPHHRPPFAGAGRILQQRFDFRQSAIQAKYTIAAVTALGVPTPTRAYPLTEAGVPFSDGADGAQNLVTINNAANVLLQRAMVGLSSDGSGLQSYTGIEFARADGVNASLRNGDAGYLDVLGNGSGAAIAVACLVRRGFPAAAVRNMITKRNVVAGFQGWGMNWQGNGNFSMLADDGPTTITAVLPGTFNYSDGAWHMPFARIRRQGVGAELVEIWTEIEAIMTADISALGSLTNPGFFGLGNLSGAATNGSPENGQFALLLVWEGANAVALTQAHCQTLFRHGTDPTGLLSTYTRAGRAAEEVGYEAGHGALTLDYSGLSGAGRPAQVCLGYKASFAHASRLGLRANAAVQNLCTDSDDYSVAAWTKTGITVGTTAALLADGPSKFRNAQRLTAGGLGGNIEDSLATLAATQYTQSIYLRSLGPGNVAATLVQRNITGGADNATLAIVVTPEWQRFDLTAVTAAGQVTSGFRLIIPANEVVFAMLANFYLGPPGQLVRTTGAIATMPATNIQAVAAIGAYVRGVRGELWANAACDAIDQVAIRTIASATGAGNTNRRDQRVITGQLPEGAIYDSAGAVNHLITGALYDPRPAFIQRLLWRANAILSNGRFSALVNNGLVTNGSLVTWANSETINAVHFGQDPAPANHLNGLLALLESYRIPRAL